MSETVEHIILIRRRPQALQDLCFQAISSNFSAVLSISTEKNIDFLKRKSQLLLKKFQELEDSVCLEHAVFCLTRHLKEVDLYWFKACDIPAIVNKLATVESAFTVLSVRAMCSISQDTLWLLIRLLPKTLESLSLSFTDCTDSMLQTVKERCPYLRELYLHTCRNIHNAGVVAMCSKNEKGDLCPNTVLQKLDLTLTKVTDKGLELALENFPNLIDIRHARLDNVLFKVGFNSIRFGLTKKYNLKYIHRMKRFFPHCHDLKFIHDICPYVSELITDIDNGAISEICKDFNLLENAHFMLHAPRNFSPFFFEVRETACNLSPFFEIRGKTLKALTISHLADLPVFLETLIKSCPRLEYLNLKFPMSSEERYVIDCDSQYTLPCLREIEICINDLEDLEGSLIYLLSRSPNLEKFTLRHIYRRDSCYIRSLFEYFSMPTFNELEMCGVDLDISKLSNSMPNFKIKLLKF